MDAQSRVLQILLSMVKAAPTTSTNWLINLYSSPLKTANSTLDEIELVLWVLFQYHKGFYCSTFLIIITTSHRRYCTIILDARPQQLQNKSFSIDHDLAISHSTPIIAKVSNLHEPTLSFEMAIDQLNSIQNGLLNLNVSKSESSDQDIRPRVHPFKKAPQCEECSQLSQFFNFDCVKCADIVGDDKTSISELFAIARQWCPSVQTNMNTLVHQMLARGAHPDDRDQLTDM